MQLLLEFCCQMCDKKFIVVDDEVDTEMLNCPYCNGDVEVPEDDDEDDD